MAMMTSSIAFLSTCRNIFAGNILESVVIGSKENIIISPASIHVCLGMLFLAANGKTAEELRRVLYYGDALNAEVAKDIKDFVNMSFKNTGDETAVQIRTANRIYVHETHKINEKFNYKIEKAFQFRAENVSFAQTKNAIHKINIFVRECTKNKIKNLALTDVINAETSALLINVIHFKGRWEKPFDAELTTVKTFTNLSRTKTPVQTMFMDGRIYYGEFEDLDAKVIELPYRRSDISMMLFLPTTIDGFEALERNISSKDLNEISMRLSEETVDILLPKFHIDCDMNLKATLQKLGLRVMFTNQADFSDLLDENDNQRVSEVKHKVVIDVCEAGSNASISLKRLKTPRRSSDSVRRYFIANHPFIFFIRNIRTVFFEGHVVKL